MKDVVTRAVSGHATSAMQQHYSTVASAEMREGIGRVISLAKVREVMAARGSELAPDSVHQGVLDLAEDKGRLGSSP